MKNKTIYLKSYLMSYIDFSKHKDRMPAAGVRKDWEGCGMLTKTPVWNISEAHRFTCNRGVVSWLGMRGAPSKGSVTHIKHMIM